MKRREFIGGVAATLAMSALGEGGRSGIRLRFLGTGAAGVWKGAPRRQSSVLLEDGTLIDFTACNLDMLPEGCRPDSILYTHSHGDHYDPVAALKLGVKRVYAHETWANCARRHFAEFGAKLGLPPPEVIALKFGEPVTVNGKPYAAGRLIGIEFDGAWTFLLPKYSGKGRAIENTEDDLARFAAEPDVRIGHDFSAFKARGGKLIMYGGLEDLSCPEPEMREFYDAVVREMGGIGEVSAFFAYYAVPGRSHGAKGEPFGPGQVGWPTQKERNDKLVDWVEKGARPGALNFVWAHETNKTLSITPYPENKVTYADAAPYAASRPDYLVFTPRQRHADKADPTKRGDSYNDHFQVIWDEPRRRFHAFWTQGTGEGKGDMHVVYSTSADKGATWTYPRVLAGSEFAATPKPRAVWQQPMLAKSGRLYCLWNQQVTDDRLHHGEMRGIFSDDGGVTWGAPQKIEMKRQLRDQPGKPPSWCNWQRPLRLGKDGRFFVGCTRRGTDPQEGHTSTKIEFWEFENVDEDPEPKDIRIGYYATGKDSLAVEIGNINRYLAEEAGIVKLPDGRLFALVRTRARHPFWSQSRDGGRTWSALKPLVGPDGKPFLHPCSPCPIYDWKGCEAGSGTYFAFIHNAYDDSIEPLGRQPRGPLYLIAGTFDPAGEQPIRFSAPKLFSPVRSGNSYYASYTVADGEGVLWFAHQKHWFTSATGVAGREKTDETERMKALHEALQQIDEEVLIDYFLDDARAVVENDQSLLKDYPYLKYVDAVVTEMDELRREIHGSSLRYVPRWRQGVA